jgi:CAAX protease family protein
VTALPDRPAWSPGFVARRLLVGFGVGAAITAACALLLWITGAYRLQGWDPRLPPAFVLGLPVFAWIEELIFRRLLLDRLVRWWGRTAGLLLSSLAFGALHAMNPGGASPTAMFGVFLAGLWLGQLYLRHRRVVACSAGHLAWNALLGPVFGFPVSGIGVGGLLSWSTVGGAWSTGGIFGPEASLWTWLVFAGAIALLEIAHRRS